MTKSVSCVAVFLNIVLLTSTLCAQPGRSFPIEDGRLKLFKHTRSLNDRISVIWRSAGRFTKNPDVIQLPSGRLMLIYSDTDSHWSQEDQTLILLASDDDGKTWFKHREIVTHDIRKGEERFATPRLSRLEDGRLVVLIDQDDFGHFHEDQPPGILAFWSADGGETWSGPQDTGIQGFEPDRVIDLPSGELAVASHVMRGESQEFAEIITTSSDGGQTWSERATVAHDGFHRFCEGGIVLLDGGSELACVMRENHSAGIPGFIAFSKDMGRTWSKPKMLPFAIHRPYAKQLRDGRVLVTGRHVNGGLGTYAWCGDLRAEAGRYRIGGPRGRYTAKLTSDALVIENKPDHDCRYSLLPPESSKSQILFEAEVKVEGATEEPVAFLSISRVRSMWWGTPVLYIAPTWIALSRPTEVDVRRSVDMTKHRRIGLRLRRGLLQVLLDGKPVINHTVFWESDAIGDFRGHFLKRTQFGQIGDAGRSYWKSVTYDVKNPSQPPFNWSWRAADGEWPDQYQRERMIQIHANPANQKHHPNHRPDHGYSSWLEHGDGRIFLVDYTNFGDPQGKAHLVSVSIKPEDLQAAGTD